MTDRTPPAGRRTFLKIAGALAASAAAGCEFETRLPAPSTGNSDRESGFDRTVLNAVAEAVLPAELGDSGREAATRRFVEWSDGYDPVAEEMHGYGYADIRFLPADPAPAWRAQLSALDLLAKRSRSKAFAALPVEARRELLQSSMKGGTDGRLPAPLDASHIAVALLSHWASSPDAWDLALGARVQPGNCRVLGEANAKPLPITGLRA
ncbi:MAG TPA: gluconate 2-dehydrogenase subunit 3 family protein [Gemmatimonadaceae bacterium]|nr:gluconate 2-dehydrogenase subunit 3 family protein [Gemmatimonadaceae bacterium]